MLVKYYWDFDLIIKKYGRYHADIIFMLNEAMLKNVQAGFLKDKKR